MKILSKEKKLCTACMQEHEVKLVKSVQKAIIKGKVFNYEGIFEYCENTGDLYASDDMLNANGIAKKDAYKALSSLLTSMEIKSIREMYGVSQKDMGLILGWGSATLGRYETYQIQDEIHNDVLCLIRDNPSWFLSKLETKKNEFTKVKKGTTYTKYYNSVAKEVKKQNRKLFGERLEDAYTHPEDEAIFYGNTIFDLKKVVEMINYIAGNAEVHKVKLMKLLWYSDALAFKRNGKSITGMPYCAIEMGAVPECFEVLVHVEGVKFEVKHYFEDDREQYKFVRNDKIEIKSLSKEELKITDTVLANLGPMSTKEIVDAMHEEMAFKKTKQSELISFEYAKELRLS